MKYMRLLITGLVLLVAAVLLFYNTKGDSTDAIQPGQYRTITPAEAKERLEEEEGIILLDVRTAGEYNEQHLPGSVLLPLDSIENEAGERIPDKASIIFVYCRSGSRSEMAANKLLGLGYLNVFDLGGILDWPYETE